MNHEEKDMYLPIWVCGLGVLLLAAAAVLFVTAFFTSIYCLAATAACLGLGAAAILCWKNQWAIMVDQNTFVYSTMFGRKIQYRFSEIRELKQGSDSSTLIMEDGKVHIESCAILSERFLDAIDSRIEKM